MLNCPLDTCVYRCQLITHVHIGTICDQKFKMAAHLSNETTCLHRPLFAGPLSGRYRQVWLYYQIFFQGMHQIALFRVKNCKSSLPWEGDTPLPHPPPRALRAHGLGRSAPSQLCPPNPLTLATPLSPLPIVQVSQQHFEPFQELRILCMF